MPRTWRSVRERETWAWPKGRTRPSQLTKVPFFSTAGATGRTTSACSLTSLRRTSSCTVKPLAARAARARPGSGKSRRSMPPTTAPPRLPSRSAERMAVTSRPGVAGRRCSGPRFQACSTWARASGSATGRPPGRRPGSRPASMPPRSPLRRGTQARWAPVAVARASATLSRPGTRTARSPMRMVAPSERRASTSSGWVWLRWATTRASSPGGVRMAWAESLRLPALRQVVTVATLTPPARTPLRRRRNREPHSSSGSRPRSRTCPARSRWR